MAIEVTPQLNVLMYILVGDPFLQANEDGAARSAGAFEQHAGDVRKLADLIDESVLGTARALPPNVGRAYRRAMQALHDDGGVNHLRAFADHLDTVAAGRRDMSTNIALSKWELIAELVRTLIDLWVSALLAAFTGGATAARSAEVMARSRVKLLLVLDALASRVQHVMGGLTGAADEAFQALMVRLAAMVFMPRDRRPRGIDWGNIAQEAAFGAVNGMVAGGLGALTHLGHGPVRNVFKGDGFDGFRDLPAEGVVRNSGGVPARGAGAGAGRGTGTGGVVAGFGGAVGQAGEMFAVGGISEAVAGVVVPLWFDGAAVWDWTTLWSAGTSSMVGEGAERGAERFGAGIRNTFVNPVAMPDASVGGADEERARGGAARPEGSHPLVPGATGTVAGAAIPRVDPATVAVGETGIETGIRNVVPESLAGTSGAPRASVPRGTGAAAGVSPAATGMSSDGTNPEPHATTPAEGDAVTPPSAANGRAPAGTSTGATQLRTTGGLAPTSPGRPAATGTPADSPNPHPRDELHAATPAEDDAVAPPSAATDHAPVGTSTGADPVRTPAPAALGVSAGTPADIRTGTPHPVPPGVPAPAVPAASGTQADAPEGTGTATPRTAGSGALAGTPAGTRTSVSGDGAPRPATTPASAANAATPTSPGSTPTTPVRTLGGQTPASAASGRGDDLDTDEATGVTEASEEALAPTRTTSFADATTNEATSSADWTTGTSAGTFSDTIVTVTPPTHQGVEAISGRIGETPLTSLTASATTPAARPELTEEQRVRLRHAPLADALVTKSELDSLGIRYGTEADVAWQVTPQAALPIGTAGLSDADLVRLLLDRPEIDPPLARDLARDSGPHNSVPTTSAPDDLATDAWSVADEPFATGPVTEGYPSWADLASRDKQNERQRSLPTSGTDTPGPSRDRRAKSEESQAPGSDHEDVGALSAPRRGELRSLDSTVPTTAPARLETGDTPPPESAAGTDVAVDGAEGRAIGPEQDQKQGRSAGESMAGRKRAREEPAGQTEGLAETGDDREAGPGPRMDSREDGPLKRARTWSYENTEAVLRDRGLVPPTRAQYEALDSYVRAAGDGRQLELTPELLRLVNPHSRSVDGGELLVCLEATEALRDTFFGRPRPAGQPQTSRAEQSPGWTLFKRHGAPVVHGPSELGVDALLARVREAGPGTFSTVLFGREGEDGHALALVHTAAGIVWADATTHRVWAGEDGQLPGEWARGRMVWAATSGPDEVDLGGRTDQRLFDADGNRFGMPFGKRHASHSSNDPNRGEGSSRQGGFGGAGGRGAASDSWLIMQPGYASGDQFAVAAALVHDPNLHVLIARGPRPGFPGHDPLLDKSAGIADFYRSTGISRHRIHFVDVASPGKEFAWPALRQEGRRIIEQEWGFPRGQWREDQHLLGVTDATNYIAEVFSSNLRASLREAWGLRPDHDREIRAWLESRGIHLPNSRGHVLVLWARFTGKGYSWSTLRGRMEHDTSFQGVRQLLRVAARAYDAVIITGDQHPNQREHSGKWDQVVAQMRGELGVANIHQITGFWKGSDPLLAAWGGGTRTGQFRVYDYLDRHHRLRHLGFRSGNLEAMALIGHRVRYLEESNADGGNRMLQWRDRGSGRTGKGGKAPGYERLLIAEPVTASGRYSKELQDKYGQGAFNPILPGARWPKPVEVYGMDRGFTYADLEDIRDYLGVRPPSDPMRDRLRFERDRFEYFKRKYTPIGDALRWYAQALPDDDYKRGLVAAVKWADQYFSMKPETYPGGADQLASDLTYEVIPQLRHIWRYYRQLTEWYESRQQNQQPSSHNASGSGSRGQGRGGGSRRLGGQTAGGADSRGAAVFARSDTASLMRGGEAPFGVRIVSADAGQALPLKYEWLDRVNPYREQGGEFTTNCVLTAIAVDMSLADPDGATYQAPPSDLGVQGRPDGEVSGLRNYLANYRDRDPDPVAGPADVVKAMSQAPLGARGMVVVEDDDGELAHVINVMRDDNGVVFLDGQAGALAPVPSHAVSFLPTTDGIPGFPLLRETDAGEPMTRRAPLGAPLGGLRENPTAVSSVADRRYATELARLLGTRPSVDVQAVLTVLGRRRSTPQLLTPTSLDNALRADSGRTLTELANRALQRRALSPSDHETILVEAGLRAGTSVLGRDRWAASLIVDVGQRSHVVQAARRLHDGNLDTVLADLMALDRDMRRIWAIAKAWQRQYGTDIRRELPAKWAEAAGRIGFLLGHTSSEPVPMKQVEQWFERLSETHLLHSQFGWVPVTTKHPESGGATRAHLWALQLLRWGAKPRKVIVGSALGIRIASAHAEGARKGRAGTVSWFEHIAPTVDAVRESGEVVTVVMDPMLAGRPLTVPEWLNRMQGPNGGYTWLEHSLADIHRLMESWYAEDPKRWERSGSDLYPKYYLAMLTDGYATNFPKPQMPVATSWEDADRGFRSAETELLEHFLKAQERSLARKLWSDLEKLLTTPVAPTLALQRLASRVDKSAPAPDYLHRHPELDRAVRDVLGPLYRDFAAIVRRPKTTTPPAAPAPATSNPEPRRGRSHSVVPGDAVASLVAVATDPHTRSGRGRSGSLVPLGHAPLGHAPVVPTVTGFRADPARKRSRSRSILNRASNLTSAIGTAFAAGMASMASLSTVLSQPQSESRSRPRSSSRTGRIHDPASTRWVPGFVFPEDPGPLGPDDRRGRGDSSNRWKASATWESVSFPSSPAGTAEAAAPVRDLSALAELREIAVPVRIETSRYEPLPFDTPRRDRLPGEPALSGALLPDGSRRHTLPGTMSTIRYDLRRFQLATGEWVSDFTVRLSLEAGTGTAEADLRFLIGRLADAVLERINSTPGFSLPNKDLFHLNLEFGDATDAHHTVRVHHERGRTTTRDWYTLSDSGVPLTTYQLLHEVLHFIGLPDRYEDEGTVFRNSAKSTAVRANGSLTVGPPVDGAPVLSAEDLAVIAATARAGGPEVRDWRHPLAPPSSTTPPPTQWEAAHDPVRDAEPDTVQGAADPAVSIGPRDTDGWIAELNFRAAHFTPPNLEDRPSHFPRTRADAWNRFLASHEHHRDLADALSEEQASADRPVTSLLSPAVAAEAAARARVEVDAAGLWEWGHPSPDDLMADYRIWRLAGADGVADTDTVSDADANEAAEAAGPADAGSGAPTALPQGPDKGKRKSKALPGEDAESSAADIDDVTEDQALEALTNARNTLFMADARRAAAEENYLAGTSTSAQTAEDAWAQAYAEWSEADLAVELAEQQWYRVTGGAPLPVVRPVDEAEAGLPGAAPGARATNRLLGVQHVPSASHMVTPLPDDMLIANETVTAMGGRVSRALIPTGQDLMVARWVSDPETAHGWPSRKGRPGYAGDLEVQRSVLAHALQRAGDNGALRQVLLQQQASLEENRQVLRLLEDRGSALRKLRPPQLAALVMIERRSHRSREQDLRDAAARLMSAGWGAPYLRAFGQVSGLIHAVEEHLRNNMALVVNVPLATPAVLESMLSDPKIMLRNQWQIGARSMQDAERFFLRAQSMGAFEFRGLTEEMLGYPASLKRGSVQTEDSSFLVFAPDQQDLADLPRYAGLTTRYKVQGQRRFGSVVFHLKRKVMRRSTFAQADTIRYGHQVTARATGYSNLLPLLSSPLDGVLRLAYAEATGFRFDPELLHHVNNGNLTNVVQDYFEVQLHGDMTWSDLDRVVLFPSATPGDVPPAELKRRLEAFGQRHGLSFTVELAAGPREPAWPMLALAHHPDFGTGTPTVGGGPTTSGWLDTSGWKRIGQQLGSNPGGVYEDARGRRFYLKRSPSPLHAQSEVLAARLYELAGVPVARMRLALVDGVAGTASEWLSGAQHDVGKQLSNLRYLDLVRQGFAVDAWLANWDVAGQNFANLATVNGVPVRIDTGGALLFRARGERKGEAFGSKVGEWQSLRDHATNPTSAALFAAMTQDQLARSVQRVLDLRPADIDARVDSIGFSEADAALLKRRLRKRQAHLARLLDETTAAGRSHRKGMKVGASASGAVDVRPSVDYGLVPGKGVDTTSGVDVAAHGPVAAAGEVVTDRWRTLRDQPYTDPFLITESANGLRGLVRPPMSGERTGVGYAWSWHEGKAGRPPLLSLVRRIHLTAGEGATEADLDLLRSGLVQGLDEFVNRRGHQLPALQPDVRQSGGATTAGPVLHVGVEFVTDPAAAHDVVEVCPGLPADGNGMNQGTWFADAHPLAFVHEFVHGLGVHDDRDGEHDFSLMGRLHGDDPEAFALTQDHLRQIADVYAPYAHGTPLAGSSSGEIGNNQMAVSPLTESLAHGFTSAAPAVGWSADDLRSAVSRELRRLGWPKGEVTEDAVHEAYQQLPDVFKSGPLRQVADHVASMVVNKQPMRLAGAGIFSFFKNRRKKAERFKITPFRVEDLTATPGAGGSGMSVATGPVAPLTVRPKEPRPAGGAPSAGEFPGHLVPSRGNTMVPPPSTSPVRPRVRPGSVMEYILRPGRNVVVDGLLPKVLQHVPAATTRPTTDEVLRTALPVAVVAIPQRKLILGRRGMLRYRSEDGLLFRWETRAWRAGGYQEVFEKGFEPRNPRRVPSIADYQRDNLPSCFVSTTRSETAQYDGWGTDFRYLIDAPGGIDVTGSMTNEVLSNEREIAFPGGIRREFIVGVEIVNGARLNPTTGGYERSVTFVPNPYYNPEHRIPPSDRQASGSRYDLGSVDPDAGVAAAEGEDLRPSPGTNVRDSDQTVLDRAEMESGWRFAGEGMATPFGTVDGADASATDADRAGLGAWSQKAAFSFAEGTRELSDLDQDLLDDLAGEVAAAGLRNARAGLQLPVVRISAGGNGSVLSGQEQSAREVGRVRLRYLEASFRSRLGHHLAALQGASAGQPGALTAGQFAVVPENRGRALPPGTEGLGNDRELRRRAFITAEIPSDATSAVSAGPISSGVRVVSADAGGVLPKEYEWLKSVNPFRARGGEFVTNCVLTSIAVDMTLADPDGAVYQAPPSQMGTLSQPSGEVSGLRNSLANYLDRVPDPVDGPAAVVEAMSRAPLGARGMVVFGKKGSGTAHVINVVHTDRGVVFLDGQYGVLAPLPNNAKFFLPTTDGIPGFPLRRQPGTSEFLGRNAQFGALGAGDATAVEAAVPDASASGSASSELVVPEPTAPESEEQPDTATAQLPSADRLLLTSAPARESRFVPDPVPAPRSARVVPEAPKIPDSVGQTGAERGESAVDNTDAGATSADMKSADAKSADTDFDAVLDRHRPARVDATMPPPAPLAGPVRFDDGTQLPEWLTSTAETTYGTSLPVLRGIDGVVAHIVERAEIPEGEERQRIAAELKKALGNAPRRFGGDGWESSPFTVADKTRRILHVVTRPHHNWERFTGPAAAAKLQDGQSSQTSTGATRTLSRTRQIAPAVVLGPLGAAAVGFGRLGFAFARTRGYEFNLTDQNVSQIEMSTTDKAGLHLTDVQYDVEVRRYSKRRRPWHRGLIPGLRREFPWGVPTLSGFTFGVRHGLSVRLTDGMMTRDERDTLGPKEIRLGPSADYRMVRTEGVLSVKSLRRDAIEAIDAQPGSTAYAQISEFFTSESFQQHAERLHHGPVTGPPLFRDDSSRTPIGAFVVERMVPLRARLLSETEAAELSNAVQQTVKNERTLSVANSQEINATAGPSSTFGLDLLGLDSWAARVMVGLFGRISRSTTHNMGFGGSGARKSTASVKDVPTVLYEVEKQVVVRWTGSGEAKTYTVRTLDRMPRYEARRLAGWDDGTGLRKDADAVPQAPVYLTKDEPPMLGASRVEAFSWDDGGHVRPLPERAGRPAAGAMAAHTPSPGTGAEPYQRTLLEGFTDQVLRALAQRYPHTVAPLEELGNPDDKRWHGKQHYLMVLQNTLRVIGALSHHSVAGNLEALITTGIRIPLVEPRLLSRAHRYVWIDARMVNRRYEGTQSEPKLKHGISGSEKLDGSRTAERATEEAIEFSLMVRSPLVSKVAPNAGTLGAGPRWGQQRSDKTGYGGSASFETSSTGKAPHLYRYDLLLSAQVGGYSRPRSLWRGAGTLGVLGLQFFVRSKPPEALVGGEAGEPVRGQVLISVPGEHTPPTRKTGMEADADASPADVREPMVTRKETLDADTAGALARGGELVPRTPGGRSGGPSHAQPSPDVRPFGGQHYLSIGLAAHRDLGEAVEAVMSEAAHGSWHFTQLGAPARDTIDRAVLPHFLSAGIDLTTSAAGLRLTGLFGQGSYLDRLGTLIQRVRLQGVKVVSEPIVLDMDQQVSAVVQASGGVTKGSSFAFVGQGAYTRAQGPGARPVMGTYALTWRTGSRKSRTSNVTRSVSIEHGQGDKNRKYLISADAQHQLLASAGNRWHGVLLTIPNGWLGAVPERVAHRLKLVDDGVGDVPLYTERPWSPPAWAGGVPFHAFPVGTLDASQALGAFDEKLAALGVDEAERNRVRNLASPRALRSMREQMTAAGVAVRARADWLSVRFPYDVLTLRIGGRTVPVRVQLVAGEPVFDGLGHSVDLSDNRTASETVDASVTTSRSKGLGMSVREGLSTGNSVVGTASVAYTESGNSQLSTTTSKSEERSDGQSLSLDEPHAEFLTPYRLRLTIGIEGVPPVEEDIGELRERVPLSVVVPKAHRAPAQHAEEETGSTGQDPLETTSPPRPPRSVTLWRNQVTAEDVVRWRQERPVPPGLTASTFQPRRIVGLENIRDASEIVLATAYGRAAERVGELTDDVLDAAVAQARSTVLTVPGIAPSLARENAISDAALSGFFMDALGTDGYAVPGQTDDALLGDVRAGHRFWARPDLTRARLLAVAPSATMNSTSKVSQGQDTTVARSGTHDTSLTVVPTVAAPATGSIVPGPSGTLLNNTDDDGTKLGSSPSSSTALKQQSSRAFLFAVPTDWLGVAEVSHALRDSKVGAYVHRTLGPFGRLNPGQRGAETRAFTLAWIREDAARAWGMIDDRNFPKAAADAWDAVKAAGDAWTEADRAYWDKRRGFGEIRDELRELARRVEAADEARVESAPADVPTGAELLPADAGAAEEGAFGGPASTAEGPAGVAGGSDAVSAGAADAEGAFGGPAAAAEEATGVPAVTSEGVRPEEAPNPASAADELAELEARRAAKQEELRKLEEDLVRLKEAAVYAATEFHRVRYETDRLTRWYQLDPKGAQAGNGGLRDGVPRPPAVVFTPPAGDTEPAVEHPRFTVSDDGSVLISPEGRTFEVRDVPQDGNGFFHALDEALMAAVPGHSGLPAGSAPHERAEELRQLLAHRLADPGNQDLWAFAVADTLDTFTPEELADAGIVLPQSSSAEREFMDAHRLSPYLSLPEDQRGLLAAAALRRSGVVSGRPRWNQGAADLLPVLAARTFGVQITVVGDGGFFAAFPADETGTLRGEQGEQGEGPSVVLRIADEHFQAALPPGTPPGIRTTAVGGDVQSSAAPKPVTVPDRPAHDEAPWKRARGADAWKASDDGSSITAPDGTVHGLLPPSGAGNGFWQALEQAVPAQDRRSPQAILAERTPPPGTVPNRLVVLTPQQLSPFSDDQRFKDAMADRTTAYDRELTDAEQTALIRAQLAAGHGWSPALARSAAAIAAEEYRAHITVVHEDGTSETYGPDRGTAAHRVTLYRRGSEYLLVRTAAAAAPSEETPGAPAVVSQAPGAAPQGETAGALADAPLQEEGAGDQLPGDQGLAGPATPQPVTVSEPTEAHVTPGVLEWHMDPEVLAVQVTQRELEGLRLGAEATSWVQMMGTVTVGDLRLSPQDTLELARSHPDLFRGVKAVRNGPMGGSTTPDPGDILTADAPGRPAFPAGYVKSHPLGRLTPILEEPEPDPGLADPEAGSGSGSGPDPSPGTGSGRVDQ
ncbi:toxin glutamine deamidase domain-containing protein [Streptomyces sp. NPDC052721]|uniref:scabin-related ADP-ribosyltransferase n=1 Tax=Streptomyces sp. NPDC052721 TaxID=3154955 RepID=UPI00341973CF